MAKYQISLLILMALLCIGKCEKKEVQAPLEEQVDEISRLISGLLLTESKIKKDAKIIRETAISKSLDPKKFAQKISALMISNFLDKASNKDATLILNGAQIGYINATFEELVKIDYSSINEVKLTNQEETMMETINDFIKEANKNIEYYDPAAPKRPAREFMEDVNVDDLPDSDLTWFEYIQRHGKLMSIIVIAVSIPAYYIGIFGLF